MTEKSTDDDNDDCNDNYDSNDGNLMMMMRKITKTKHQNIVTVTFHGMIV